MNSSNLANRPPQRQYFEYDFFDFKVNNSSDNRYSSILKNSQYKNMDVEQISELLCNREFDLNQRQLTVYHSLCDIDQKQINIDQKKYENSQRQVDADKAKLVIEKKLYVVHSKKSNVEFKRININIYKKNQLYKQNGSDQILFDDLDMELRELDRQDAELSLEISVLEREYGNLNELQKDIDTVDQMLVKEQRKLDFEHSQQTRFQTVINTERNRLLQDKKELKAFRNNILNNYGYEEYGNMENSV